MHAMERFFSHFSVVVTEWEVRVLHWGTDGKKAPDFDFTIASSIQNVLALVFNLNK